MLKKILFLMVLFTLVECNFLNANSYTWVKNVSHKVSTNEYTKHDRLNLNINSNVHVLKIKNDKRDEVKIGHYKIIEITGFFYECLSERIIKNYSTDTLVYSKLIIKVMVENFSVNFGKHYLSSDTNFFQIPGKKNKLELSYFPGIVIGAFLYKFQPDTRILNSNILPFTKTSNDVYFAQTFQDQNEQGHKVGLTWFVCSMNAKPVNKFAVLSGSVEVIAKSQFIHNRGYV